MKVLVAYASKHGSTAQIAAAIADALARHPLTVEFRQVGDAHHIDGYDAVVVGSAIYFGRWLAAAHGLMEEQRHTLVTKRVWVFSCGRIPERPEIDIDAAQVRWLLEVSGAREHKAFPGRVTAAALDWRERGAVRVLRAPYGDFRDWSEVSEWSESIARELLSGGGEIPRQIGTNGPRDPGHTSAS